MTHLCLLRRALLPCHLMLAGVLPSHAREIPGEAVKAFTVFRAGEGGIHSYRIPAIVTAKDGSMLVFAEGRKNTWKDKSPTDLVLKRSTDGGHTWSPVKRLLDGGSGAHMDPTPVVDAASGRLFVFTCFWPAKDHSSHANTAWLITSDNHGVTWSAPQDVTSQVLKPGYSIMGFGPGSGVCMGPGSPLAGRLIVPVRSSANKDRAELLLTAYSDNRGTTWRTGQAVPGGCGETSITEAAPGRLVLNRRGGAMRYRSFSADGGESWSTQEGDPALQSVEKGCHGCVFGMNGMVFYTGPAGIPAAKDFDNRARLQIVRSEDGGRTWPRRHILHQRAAGYSSLAPRPGGGLALVFEAADTRGFRRTAERPAGWMRLDLLLLPEPLLKGDAWFASE